MPLIRSPRGSYNGLMRADFYTALEVLDGTGPANTSALRRIEPLGRTMRYSGGGSTIMQVALQDVTGMDFTRLMRTTVLEPLGMSRSTFQQPLCRQGVDRARRFERRLQVLVSCELRGPLPHSADRRA
jgi:CubicO group peptidase (beta-lactamase class C family)